MNRISKDPDRYNLGHNLEGREIPTYYMEIHRSDVKQMGNQSTTYKANKDIKPIMLITTVLLTHVYNTLVYTSKEYPSMNPYFSDPSYD